MGHFPPGAPTTMRAALLRGQLTCEQMVDRYPIRNRAVRQLLIDYFVRRSADTDYSSMKGLVLAIAHTFWEKIQEINPTQADLRISPEVYAAWRQSIASRDDGKPRIGQDGIVIMIRSFYFDLHTWAVDEPERWAQWVAPCPIPPSELRGLGRRRRQVNERSADRTRVRQPLLPVLVDHVETRYQQASDLLERARQAAEGESFEAGGRTYQRTLTDTDRRRTRPAATRPRSASATRPRARSSTSRARRRARSGTGPASRPCATPGSVSRSSASSRTSASGTTSGPTGRRSRSW